MPNHVLKLASSWRLLRQGRDAARTVHSVGDLSEQSTALAPLEYRFMHRFVLIVCAPFCIKDKSWLFYSVLMEQLVKSAMCYELYLATYHY